MDLYSQLSHEKHLEREKGLERLEKEINEVLDTEVLNKKVSEMLDSDRWESIYGGLKASRVAIENTKHTQETVEKIKSKVIELMCHNEYRVRVAFGECLGEICKAEGPEVLSLVRQPLFKRIFESFNPELISSDSELEKEYVLKGGAGWQNLETSMKILQCVMQGLSEQFDSQVDEEFWKSVDLSCNHPNRFVREIGQMVCGDVCSSVSFGKLEEVSARLKDYISLGLSDNWSQVRYAASVSVRKFITKLGSHFEQFEGELIPKMCLNRYYVAEGVRLYSIETWKLYCGDKGREVVARNINSVGEYYISQCSADNHAVREAACLCIAELASKVSSFAYQEMQGLVPRLLDGLIDCFKDESWPVRDASCQACADFVSVFPNESSERLPELKELWTRHLSDNINSVRDHSAFSIKKALVAYKDSSWNFIEEVKVYLKSNLSKAREEPEFERSRPHQPTDQQMYSCGSLAPKLKRGGGCMDHGFSRESHPWEYSEGCVHLLREISEEFPEIVLEDLEELAEIVRFEGYSSACYFKETVWSSLPGIAKGVGKNKFKSQLEVFIDPLFRDSESSNANLCSATRYCIKELNKLFGPNIFRGRVEMHNPSYVEVLQRVLAN